MKNISILAGTLGAGFIGSFHSYSLAMQKLVKERHDVNLVLKCIADTDQKVRQEVKERFGYLHDEEHWQKLITDKQINLFVNAAPNNLHLEPCIAFAENGVPILCEKPLSGNADDALLMLRSAQKGGIVNQAAFIHRFIPAIRYMREIIKSGDLGEPIHFRSSYLMSDYLDPTLKMSWRLDHKVAGLGTFGDLGSHHIDTARYLIGEIKDVFATARINVPEVEGKKVEVDDAFASIVTFDSGMVGTIEASRVAAGYGHFGRIEVDCTKGSLQFQVGKLNELNIAEGINKGFRTIQVIGPEHPLSDFWWDGGVQGSHPIGWVECFVHQMHHFIGAVIGKNNVEPLAASFKDGYRVAEIADQMVMSWKHNQRVEIKFRE